MKTTTRNFNDIRLGATLIGLICAGTAGAQQQQLDRQSDQTSDSAQMASCMEVDWAKELLALYPRIAEGCQEVMIVDAVKWARFDADFVQSDTRIGTVTLDFKDRMGRPMGNLILQQDTEQLVYLDGRSIPISQLTRGQTLNLYVPEGMFAVGLEPGAPPEQLAQIVRQPANVTPATTAPVAQLAQANRSPIQATARQLPATAGILPLIALAGLLSLLAGFGLTVRRLVASKK